MNRRDFIKTSSIVTLPLLLKSCGWQDEGQPFPVHVHSDAGTGHLVYQSDQYERITGESVEVVIVGGGIAGLAAACKLKDRDFLLFELSSTLGGTSSAYRSEELTFAQGAHYDMGYPQSYGSEVLDLLESLNIISYQPWKEEWGFTDQEHLVMHRRKNQCYDHGEIRKEVIKAGRLRDRFFELLKPYQGQMHLPTRLIDAKYRPLDRLSFVDFLGKNLDLNDQFLAWVGYHTKDDYGADAHAVSALAGIHYFTCRPYNSEIVELFSPPEGNHYFINKMADRVDGDRLKPNHLVKHITETPNGFRIEVIDTINQQVRMVTAKKVVYAGQKHALKYIFPEDASLFANNRYAPWMVVNLVLERSADNWGYWQNEMLTRDETFLGFIDSTTQHKASPRHRVLTAYYCLPPSSRNDLVNVEATKNQIAKSTAQHISNYWGKDIRPTLRQVDIKVMGHAMPIPGKGYLFDDKNQYRKNSNIVYAGVDNSRLPLLFEAVDSGIMAAGMI